MSYDKWDEYDPAPTEGYCNDCNETVEITPVDHGIGPYEYWGAKGNHKDVRATCTLCGGCDVDV